MDDAVNIHTHLIPAMIWLRDHLPNISTSAEDLPSLIFTSAALLCLFSSAVWHTMSGCAHYTGMVTCARLDYVGIGWLISASVGTVVHYGFYCHETPRILFLALCVASAVLGTVFPFMEWFNKFEYRVSTITLIRRTRSDGTHPAVPDRFLSGDGILRSRSLGLDGPPVWVLGNDCFHQWVLIPTRPNHSPYMTSISRSSVPILCILSCWSRLLRHSLP